MEVVSPMARVRLVRVLPTGVAKLITMSVGSQWVGHLHALALTLNQPRTHLCVRGLHKSVTIYVGFLYRR